MCVGREGEDREWGRRVCEWECRERGSGRMEEEGERRRDGGSDRVLCVAGSFGETATQRDKENMLESMNILK